MASLLLINGPNLNPLGSREPEVYGRTGPSDIERKRAKMARTEGHELACFQSNAAHEIVNRTQQAAIRQSHKEIQWTYEK
jgi:3-dehydroquinate dehydratase-2